MQGHWGAAVSANPFLGVRFRGGARANRSASCGLIIKAVPARVRPLSAEQKTEGAFVRLRYWWWAPLLALFLSAQVAGDDGVFDEYRDLMGDDNPAVFVIDEGEEFWFMPQGPQSASLESCDLGLGPGVTAGAYVKFPRYFEDTATVMDLEARILHCMATIQGRDVEAIKAKPIPCAVTLVPKWKRSSPGWRRNGGRHYRSRAVSRG